MPRHPLYLHIASRWRAVQRDRTSQFPSEVLLEIIEARLATDHPAEALGIERDASVERASAAYARVLGELERFHDHPSLGRRAVAAAAKLSTALLAFCKRESVRME